jgi:hypothetical protein
LPLEVFLSHTKLLGIRHMFMVSVSVIQKTCMSPPNDPRAMLGIHGAFGAMREHFCSFGILRRRESDLRKEKRVREEVYVPRHTW